ncbi:methyltransferase domain-containing protein [Thermoproteota archaeon]
MPEKRFMGIKDLSEYLQNIFCCPACHGDLQVQDVNGFKCDKCDRNFTVINGIPDFRFFEDTESFDAKQAIYEADLHDKEAMSDYEERVILVWGQKTKLIAHEWTREASGKILDFGCGTGQISRVLTKHHSPIFAFDISSDSISKNVAENNVIGMLANAFHLPFRSDCFDAVCINGVLHHIVNYPLVIKEISRITKGKVFISEECPAKYHISRVRHGLTFSVIMNRIVREYVKFMQKTSEKKTYFGGSKFEKSIDPQELMSCLKQNGFNDISCKFWTNLDYSARYGLIKNLLTRLLVSKQGGTHFDIRAFKKGRG